MRNLFFVILMFSITNISFAGPKGKCIDRCEFTKKYCIKVAEIKITEEIKSSNFASVNDLRDRNPGKFELKKKIFKIAKDVCEDSYEYCRGRCQEEYKFSAP